MTREDYTLKLASACKVLELERLRQVAKFAHEQMMHQARAATMQAQNWPKEFATDDTPTAGDYPDGITQPGAEPEAIVWMPAGEDIGQGSGRITA